MCKIITGTNTAKAQCINKSSKADTYQRVPGV